MAEPTETRTDRGVGLTLVLGVLAVLGALAMLASPGNALAGWGFAAAMTFATLAVVGIHLYGE